MAEIYRKRGRVVRYEGGRIVRVCEAGEALEEGRTFRCLPLLGEALPEIEETAVDETQKRLRAAITAPLSIERLIVLEGMAEHEFAGVRWTERTRRIHLSVSFRSRRMIVDLADFEMDSVWPLLEAFARCGSERDATQRIVLAPPVTAALLPSLVGIAPPNVALWQTRGGRDGKGNEIEETKIGAPPWPNWFRPSYRTRPVRRPHNIRIVCDVTVVDRGLPQAVALLAPVDGLLLHILCVEGKEVYPATVRVARIDAAAPPVRWYPYGAGSFGTFLDVK